MLANQLLNFYLKNESLSAHRSGDDMEVALESRAGAVILRNLRSWSSHRIELCTQSGYDCPHVGYDWECGQTGIGVVRQGAASGVGLVVQFTV
jgi:hypothetical protein